MATEAVPRWRGQPGFFEIWFVVAFDLDTERAWWIRYTTFAPAQGQARGTVWAAPFARGQEPVWGKRFVGVEEIHAAVAGLAEGGCAGEIETQAHRLSWRMQIEGGLNHVPRSPRWLHRLPTPTRVDHERSECVVTGEVGIDGRVDALRGLGAQKHLWGTRRVEQLYWVYCPLLDDGGALEATSVRVRGWRGPRITPVWLRAECREYAWWSGRALVRNEVEPAGPGRLRVRAATPTARIDAVAACDPSTLAGYVYRDPAGWDVYVAQSDVARCEGELRTRRHLLAPWHAAQPIGGALAAIEFHQLEPLPGVRYVPWDGTEIG